MKQMEATVVFKAHFSGVNSVNGIIASCYVTFELDSKERMVFVLDIPDYMNILEGDKGILTFEEEKGLFGKSNGNFAFKSFEKF